MKRTILAVVVTAVLSSVTAHAADLSEIIQKNLGDLQSLQPTDSLETVRSHWQNFYANVRESYDPTGQIMSYHPDQKAAFMKELAALGADYGLKFRGNEAITVDGYTPVVKPVFTPITTTEEALAHSARYSMRPVHNPDTQEHIEEMAHNPLYSQTAQGQKASAILEQQANERLAAAAAVSHTTEVQDDSDVSAIEKVQVGALTFIQPVATPTPAPVAAPVAVPESAQTQSIRANLDQAKAAYLAQSDKTSPVGVAMRDTMTGLMQQLKQSQQADQFKPLADEVNKANIKAGFEAAQNKPASYDAPANAEQADRDQSQEEAAKPATYDAPAGAEQADKVAAQEAQKTAQAKQEAAEGQAKADALATGPKAQRMLEARQDAKIAALEAESKPVETAAEPVKTAATVETDKAPVETKTNTPSQPAKTQVINQYTISGMTAKQAAQQQDNTDQILSHSRAIASNRDAIQQNSQKIDRLQSQQDTDRKAAKAGTANALAVSGIHYVDTDNSIAIGAGTYEGQNAGSIGYRHKFSQNVAATIAASQDSNGGTGAAASLAIGW